ncbi:MAG: replication-associated recombination protein A [Campylobacterales bacterium]
MGLAEELRPATLSDFVGQEHLVGVGAPLRRLIEEGKVPHLFFYGPPGTGKTTLARLIASLTGRPFFELNATEFKTDDFRKIITSHRGSLLSPVLFIDEVHRLIKTQQDLLLPVMEKGEALVIGSSTENPFFSLTSAIRSRSFLFEFKPLSDRDLEKLIARAIVGRDVVLEEGAKAWLIGSSGGDARAMLNLLDVALNSSNTITLQLLKSFRPFSLNDGTSSNDTHYDLASALIKSIRGSDPDAALYYLARLIKGGENPEFIARRLVILASEDIGNANPEALVIATAAMQLVVRIGWPESAIILAQAVIYLAHCPKSNAVVTAIDEAMSDVEKGVLYEIPAYLRDAHYPGAKEIGRGNGYLYPHDFGGWVAQRYWMGEKSYLKDRKIGYEKRLHEWLVTLRGE